MPAGTLTEMHTIGLVLHPERDSAEAVTAVLDWAARKGAQVWSRKEYVLKPPPVVSSQRK